MQSELKPAPKKRRVPKSKVRYPISFTYNGVVIDYVGKTLSELPIEYRRVRHAFVESLRYIQGMTRANHVLLHGVRAQLQLGLPHAPGTTPEETARIIAKMNWILGDCLKKLALLKYMETSEMRRLRFCLTYGQTPVCRDFDGTPAIDKSSTEESSTP